MLRGSSLYTDWLGLGRILYAVYSRLHGNGHNWFSLCLELRLDITLEDSINSEVQFISVAEEAQSSC